MDLEQQVRETCARARAAARAVATARSQAKSAALRALAQGLRENAGDVLAANDFDLELARAHKMSAAHLDRLALSGSRVEAMARAVDEIAGQADPVGETIESRERPNGLRVRRVRVPIGVIAMVYEAQPNVTAEAAALCIAAGNAVVLRGGPEAVHSNAAIAPIVSRALDSAGLPRDAVQLLESTDRSAIQTLVRQTANVDLVIPRGGDELVLFVEQNARVPVIKHYKGVCHLFVDAGADVGMAARIAVDAKLHRPGTCNSLECLLIDLSDAPRLLPPIAKALADGGCELRGDERTRALVPFVQPADAGDYGREFLDTIIMVHLVEGIEGAIAHVARFGSGHTEAICTRNPEHAERWRREVDAACVCVNASTRFHDGGELGLGAEIGIATSKLHWRGAMGVEALTTFKWIVDGEGHTRV